MHFSPNNLNHCSFVVEIDYIYNQEPLNDDIIPVNTFEPLALKIDHKTFHHFDKYRYPKMRQLNKW